MKRFLFQSLFFLLLLSGCNLNNSGTGSNDPSVLLQGMVGGWDLVTSTGTEESWYFSPENTYIKLTRYNMESGSWRLNGESVILNETTTEPVQLNGQILNLGDRTLQKDPNVVRQLETRLGELLVGTWKSTVEESTYEFVQGGYYLSKFEDGMTVDGQWRIEANKLIIDNADFAADPIAIENNQLRWGTETFNRIGESTASIPEGMQKETDTPEESRPVAGTTSPVGDPINQHAFDANLGNFGNVRFSPYWEDRFGDSKLNLYLTKNGQVVYELPSFQSANGLFDGLRSVAARDLNSDGKLDLVVMADFVTQSANGSQQIQPVNGVYINRGASFAFDQNLSRKINAADNINTVNDIVAFARNSGTSTSTSSTSGTTTSKGTGSTPSYAKYKSDKSICRIRVASLAGPIDYDRINKLSDLGIISYEPADNGYTRVYLGKYISKYTAYRILQTVKRRGHSSAFVVVEQDFINEKPKQDPTYYTFQLLSSNKLNLKSFNELDDQYRGDVYISFTGTRYRVSLGLFQKELYPYLEEEFKTLGARMGYANGFSNSIR